MKQARHLTHWLFYALLSGCVLNASALTLGRIQGAVLIGRPLDVTIPIEFAADETPGPDLAAPCYSADVHFGDTLLNGKAVTWQTTAGATPQIQLLRITTLNRVDEPTVSVSLQAGCGKKTARRYVMLAEMLTEPTPYASSPAAVLAPVGQIRGQSAALAGPATDAAPAATFAGHSTAAAGPAAAAASEPAGKKSKHKSAGKRSRLKLKDVAVEPDAGQAAKKTRRTERLALEGLEQRIDALDQWKETMPAPEQVTQIQGRLQTFETNLKGLQALTLKNQQNLQAVATELGQIQANSQDGNLLLYVISGILALCVSAVGWLLYKSRRVGRIASKDSDWSASVQAPAEVAAPVPRLEPVSAAPASVADSVPVAKVPTKAVINADTDKLPIDLDIGAGADAFAAMDSVPAPAEETVVRSPEKRDFSNSITTTFRSVNTREMLDVRQQAEFFMALGQHDEAVRVLETSIQQSHDANPLVILDLLKIFHTLGRRGEFDHYRQEFNLQFTGRVPEYAGFLLESQGLENYADICREIAALWPSEEALDYIEQCLVRTTEDKPGQGFDLEAYRDLLLLHGVLKRMDTEQDSQYLPFSAVRQPAVLHESEATLAEPTALERTLAEPDFKFGEEEPDAASLDLDLSEKSDNLIDFKITGLGLEKPKSN